MATSNQGVKDVGTKTRKKVNRDYVRFFFIMFLLLLPLENVPLPFTGLIQQGFWLYIFMVVFRRTFT